MDSRSASEHDEKRKSDSDYGIELIGKDINTGAQLLYGTHADLNAQEGERVK
jgi:hypothetical protein